MLSGQVKPMLADVVQANTHINALIGFVVRPSLIERKAEHAVLAS